MARPGERPTPDRYLDALNGFHRTSAVVTALELDLFTQIGATADPTPERLGTSLGCAPRGVRILADYLVTLGLLAKAGSSYRLTPESATYLDRRSKAYLGDARRFLTAPILHDGFDRLTESVRRGGTALEGEGSLAPDHPLWVDYARAMAPMVARTAERVADRVVDAGFHPDRILDLAAGHGLFGLAIARRVPGSELTALDWPSVVGVARENADRAGLGERFRARTGDALSTDLGGPYDVVVAANFLHHFDRPTMERLLRRIRSALAPGGRLAVVEFVPDDDRVTPPATAQFALTLLATTRAGDLYTAAEYAAALAAAGFQPPAVHPLERSPLALLVAAA